MTVGQDALPLVAVAQGEFVHGLASVDKDDPRVRDLLVVPFDVAFEQQAWLFDAFVMSYQVVDQERQPVCNDQGKPAWPRINKPALAGIRKLGLDVQSVMLIQDWDLPGKTDGEVWTEESFGEFQHVLAEHVARGDFWATRWTLAYTTRAGARFVYLLSRWVPVEDHEPLHRGLLHSARDTGWHFDYEIKSNGVLHSRCSDWTRLMRLPRVMRDGEASWESPFFWFEAHYDRTVDPDEIVPVGPPSTVTDYAAIDREHGSQPTTDEARTLLVCVDPRSGNEVWTAWAAAARKALKGRDTEDVAFRNLPIAPPEGPGRDTAMTRLVGEACAILTRVRGTTAAHVYAIFREAVEQLIPDRDTPDWLAKLWDLCERLWTAELAKAEAEEANLRKLDEDALAHVEDTMAGIVRGMRTWCATPELHSEDLDEVTRWTHEHLIALAVSGQCYVMTEKGVYDTLGVPLPQLASRVRQLGMSGLIALKQPSADGGRMIDVPSSSLLAAHGTHVAQVRAAVEVEGAWIEDMGKPHATLVVPAFSRRKDLVPTFDHEVDHWLLLFAGPEYDKLCEWLAWSLAYDEGPICALSVAGKKSIGKNMLVRGLCEALTGKGVPAKIEDLVGNYQYGLLGSPFLHIDEGLPEFMVRHPADTFREFVGGSALTINRRYRDPVTFECPTRIILTANNNDVVGKLCGGRDMSAEDREAIGLRLFHLDVTDRNEAAEWLESKGGREYTGKQGRRWVRGSAGQPSDFILAKHLLWLWANRGAKAPGLRLLVEGDPHAPIVEQMRTDSSIAQILGKTLCEMLKAHDRKQVLRGLTIEENKLWVTSGEVHDYFVRNLRDTTRENVSISRVAHGLKTLATRHHPPIALHSRPTTKQRWYEIDPGELFRLIQRHGYDLGNNSSLEKLVEGGRVIPFVASGQQSGPLGSISETA